MSKQGAIVSLVFAIAMGAMSYAMWVQDTALKELTEVQHDLYVLVTRAKKGKRNTFCDENRYRHHIGQKPGHDPHPLQPECKEAPETALEKVMSESTTGWYK